MKRVATHDTPRRLRKLSLAALRRVQLPSQANIQLHMSLRSDPALGRQAHLGLGSLAGNLARAGNSTLAHEIVTALMEEFHHTELLSDRIVVARSVGNVRHPIALESLKEVSRHSRPAIRMLAADALRRMAGRAALEEVLELAEDDPEWTVRLAAATAVVDWKDELERRELERLRAVLESETEDGFKRLRVRHEASLQAVKDKARRHAAPQTPFRPVRAAAPPVP